MTVSTTSPDGREAGPQAYGIAPPGYRLPAATRLGAVRLQVADLARSLGWYRRVLGLEPLDREASRLSRSIVRRDTSSVPGG